MKTMKKRLCFCVAIFLFFEPGLLRCLVFSTAVCQAVYSQNPPFKTIMGFVHYWKMANRDFGNRFARLADWLCQVLRGHLVQLGCRAVLLFLFLLWFSSSSFSASSTSLARGLVSSVSHVRTTLHTVVIIYSRSLRLVCGLHFELSGGGFFLTGWFRYNRHRVKKRGEWLSPWRWRLANDVEQGRVSIA